MSVTDRTLAHYYAPPLWNGPVPFVIFICDNSLTPKTLLVSAKMKRILECLDNLARREPNREE